MVGEEVSTCKVPETTLGKVEENPHPNTIITPKRREELPL
jgi:hypothetical protein